jgi:hypothetical protein
MAAIGDFRSRGKGRKQLADAAVSCWIVQGGDHQQTRFWCFEIAGEDRAHVFEVTPPSPAAP